MTTVSTKNLKDRLSSYLHRVEGGERVLVLRGGKPVAALVPLAEVRPKDEWAQLAALEARGLVTLPRATDARPFPGPLVPSRGKLTSEMVIEDRR